MTATIETVIAKRVTARFQASGGDLLDCTIPDAPRVMSLAEAESKAASWNAQLRGFGREHRLARIISKDVWALSVAVEQVKNWRRCAADSDARWRSRLAQSAEWGA